MRDVVLVEVADLGPDAARAPGAPGGRAPGGRTPGAPRPRRRPRRRWRLAAGLAVLLVAGSVISGVRARDRAAHLAALPGMLAPLDAAPRELWRTQLRGWGDVAAVGGDILLFGPDFDRAPAVELLAGATGRPRWVAPLPEIGIGSEVRCSPLGDPARPVRVVCRLASAPARLVVLDARTGRRVADRAMDSDNSSVTSIGDDLVVAEVLSDGRVEVTRQDPVTGTARWTFRSARPLRTPGVGPSWFDVSVQHGVIVANGPVAWAFAPDGTVLGEWHLPGGDSAVTGGWGLDISVLPDGRFAVGQSGGVGLSDAQYGTVSVSDARDGFPIPGPVLQPVVDDGSAPGVLFTRPTSRGGLAALDFATGRLLWEAGSEPWGDALVLDARLVAVAVRRLTALDARSGRLLWSVDVPAGNHAQQVLTDGREILVPMLGTERGAVLVAIDPADGRTRWTTPLPTGTSRLEPVAGRLLALADRDLVALG